MRWCRSPRRCGTLDSGTIRVGAHTDASGDAVANLALSERRAGAVAAHLVELGVPSRRLVAEAFGETRPIASNDTPQGRRANRRVELDVMP